MPDHHRGVAGNGKEYLKGDATHTLYYLSVVFTLVELAINELLARNRHSWALAPQRVFGKKLEIQKCPPHNAHLKTEQFEHRIKYPSSITLPLT